MMIRFLGLCLSGALIAALGCAGTDDPSMDGKIFLLANEPAEPIGAKIGRGALVDHLLKPGPNAIAVQNQAVMGHRP